MVRLEGACVTPNASPNTLVEIDLREGADMGFRKTDRCDKCNAQAQMLAMKGDADLLFCDHHGRQHLDALVLGGWEVVDDHMHLERNLVIDDGMVSQ
jgi:hypothetical protein